jgi:hypothetical protein
MAKPPKWVLHELWLEQHGEEYRALLFRNVKARFREFDALREEALAQWPRQPTYAINDHSVEECRRLQPLIQKIATALQELLPDRPMRPYFRKVVARALENGHELAAPGNGTQEARTILDAFYRAYCYLTAACESVRTTEMPRRQPPQWWTTLLYVFELS